MKKITALLLAMMMVVAFTACGSSTEEATTTEEPSTGQVTGIVMDLADAQLSLYSEAKQDLTFNIENAEIESEGEIYKGDKATVEYEGEISGGDTSGCTVKTVKVTAGSESNIVGKVESIDGTKVTVTSNDKQYTFDTKGIKIENGKIKTADEIEIKYTGLIDDQDTSHAFIKRIAIQKEAEDSETYSIKAVNEKVWVSADVNVRSEANTSSDKVATVKKGQKLTRTGVLSNGWSRVNYEGKDRYISSKFLTTKAPQTETKTTEKKTTEKKTTESKATESKTTESKATETKATETEPTETQPTETQPTETEPTETQPTETEPTEPATSTDKGTVVEYEKGKYIKLDNGKQYNITSDTKINVNEDEIIDTAVEIEYVDDTKDALHIYNVSGDKSLGASNGMGLPTIFIILGLIAVAIAVVVTIVRSRRRPQE